MWEVYESRKADKQLGKLPIDLLKRYEKGERVKSEK